MREEMWVVLERGWRLLATACCFAVFGAGGLMLSCVVHPLFMVLTRCPQRRQVLVRATIHRGFKGFVALMKGLGVLSFEVHGLQRLQRSGQLILANHPTLVDVVFLISFVKDADCIVKAALLHNPFTRGPVSAAGFVINDSGEQLVDDCIESIRSGGNLVIFPEGTRTPLQGPVRLQRGAANVAIRGQLDITPVRIHSTEPLLTKGSPWWRVPARRPHITISVGEDIAIADHLPAAGKEALAVRQLNDYLMEQLLGNPSPAFTHTRDQRTDHFGADSRGHSA